MILPKLLQAKQNHSATEAICKAVLSVPANYTQLQSLARKGNDLQCNCLVRQQTQYIAMDKTIVSFYDTSVPEYMLEQQADENTFIETVEVTPLYIALSREDEGLLRMLIHQGVNINKRLINGLLPIEYAYQENRTKMVYFLLNHGVHIGEMKLGCPHNLQLSKALIQLGANPMSLDLSCIAGDTEQFKSALTLIPSYKYRTFTQRELLQLFQNPPLFAALIQNGFDINEAIKVYNNKGQAMEKSLFIQAIESKSESAIDILLQNNIHLNVPNSKGWTPIFYAIKTQRLSIVKKLIEQGASVSWISHNQNDTPLNLAVQLGLQSIVKELLEAGAKPYLSILKKYDLPLVRAFNNNDKAMIELLLQYTPSKEWDLSYYFEPETILYQVKRLKYALFIGMRTGEDFLQIAIAENRTEVVALILEYKNNWNSNNQQDEAALYKAIEKGNVAIATELIKSGINVNANIKGKNPLLIQAIEQNSIILVVQLLNNGANLNTMNMNGQSALNVAIQQNNYKIIKLLIDRNISIKCEDVLVAVQQQNVPILQLLKAKLGKLECRIDGRSIRYHTRDMNLSFEVENLLKGTRMF